MSIYEAVYIVEHWQKYDDETCLAALARVREVGDQKQDFPGKAALYNRLTKDFGLFNMKWHWKYIQRHQHDMYNPGFAAQRTQDEMYKW